MISASVGVNSSLLLEPAQTLKFPLEKSERGVRACLTLTNISARKHVLFKVRTTNADMFMVKPTQGAIEPEGEVTVVITMVATSCARLLQMDASERADVIERFLIQSIDRADDMRGFDMDDLSAFWKRIPKELITNKKLTCRFIEACSAEAVHLPARRVRVLSEEQPQYAQPPHRGGLVSRSPPRFPDPAQDYHDNNNYYNDNGQRSPVDDRRSPVERARRQSGPRSVEPPRSNLARSQPPPPKGYMQALPPLRNGSSASDNADKQERLANSKTSSHDSYGSGGGSGASVEELLSDVREFRIHPSDSLTFPVRHTVMGRIEGMSYFFLTNKAKYSGLAFKVKTTNHAGYFVKPSRGLIGPSGAQRIDIFMNEPDAAQFDAHERELKDRFLVEVLFLDHATYHELALLGEEHKRQQLQSIWAESESTDRLKSMLTCLILDNRHADPSQTPEQARALAQKSQASSLSLSGSGSGSGSGPSTGSDLAKTATGWLAPPEPPRVGMQVNQQRPVQERQQQPPRRDDEDDERVFYV